MDPANRTAYTMQWNANVQRTFGPNYLVEVAYTGSQSYNEHKRFNINQARPGTTPIETRVPYPAFQSAILYSSDGGWASFNGVSFRLEKRYSSVSSSSPTTSCRGTATTDPARSRRTTRRLRGTSTRTRRYSRYDQRHRSAFSCGYELPFGRASAGSPTGGSRRLRARRLAGAGRGEVRQRLPVLDHLDQRLPVRVVHPAARQLRARPRGRQGPDRQSHADAGST